MIYQQMEISRLTVEADSARFKLHNTAMLILNKTDLQYSQQDHKLNESINIQRDLITEENINVYNEKLLLIFKAILNIYHQVFNIKPHLELQQYFNTLTDKIKDVVLPLHLDDQIFEIYKPEIMVINQMLAVKFRIHIIKTSEFQRIAIISVPTAQGELINLPNQQLVYIFVFNPRNNMTFNPNTALKISTGIYDQVQWDKPNLCTLAILTGTIPNTSCNHSITTPQYDNYLLETDFAIIYPSENLSIICVNETKTIKKDVMTILVNFEKCIIIKYYIGTFTITQK